MTPRKASLRVAHQRSCPLAMSTTLESVAKGSGCKCQPSYYVMWRDRSGATKKSQRVKDRSVAVKVLNEKQVEIDKGHVGYTELRSATFPEWVARYEANLETAGVKGGTIRSYTETLDLASRVIGHVDVRQIGHEEIRRVYRATEHTTPATRLKHLRQLGACLSAAVNEGLADRNPVPSFRSTLKNVRAPKEGSAPFTDGDLLRLWAKMESTVTDPETGKAKPHTEPVYIAICRAAVATGLRQGELIALTWEDVNLTTDGAVQVRQTFGRLDGLGTPKDRDARTVYLTPAARAVLEDWLAASGAPADGLVFPAPRSGTYINADYLRKRLARVMTDAHVPKTDPNTGLKRTFHSFRRTFTRQMLEQGKHPQWVQAQLGHSSLDLTMNVYGSWSRDAMLAEAAKQTERGA